MRKYPLPNSTFQDWPWDESVVKISYPKGIKWPKISIITPSFNQAKFIEETIRSVLLQNYPNLEYIIIDGGSTDETVEIIKKYEPWINYWVSEPDNGQSHAINKGLEKCTGEIFNWLNSDDWYMPGSLFEVATSFISNSSLQFVSGFENHIAIDNSVTINEGTFLMSSLEQTIELCQVAQPSTFFKLSSIKTVQGVPEDMHYIMDGEMWVKLLLQYGQGPFVKIKKVLVNFRLHGNSKTISNAVENNFLYERSSIIIDLQRFVGVPDEIIKHNITKVYQTSRLYELNRYWQLNEKHITARQLRIYFIQQFIIRQFILKDNHKVYWGIKELVKNSSFNIFLFKSIIKLFVKL